MYGPMNRRSVLKGAAAASVAVLGLGEAVLRNVARAAGGKAAIGEWGFDLSAMDRSIEPGRDFFRYAGGTWMRTVQIPPDRSRWGSFDMLRAQSEDDVREAIEEAAAAGLPPGSSQRKAVDYYRAYLDTAAIDGKGLEPAKAELARIGAIRTHEEAAAFRSAWAWASTRNAPTSMWSV
jgi:putative endopeptidase